MPATRLMQHLEAYDSWKQNLSSQINRYYAWLKRHRLDSEPTSKRLRHAIEHLKQDEICIAVIGEVSRGKTELINALLYTDQQAPKLPSGIGRTTLCTTEIFFDPQSHTSSLHLLPIETRASKATLDQFKKIPDKWHTLRFDAYAPKQVNEAVQQLGQIKSVDRNTAEKLGFQPTRLEQCRQQPGNVMIPAWRYALLNLDHPLLRCGLRLVDTAGLNTLASEPGITFNHLPHPTHLLFLLDADKGMTASDFHIWKHHIQTLDEQHSARQCLALLNKADCLPRSDLANIQKLREQVSQRLALPTDSVVPISARQTLAQVSETGDTPMAPVIEQLTKQIHYLQQQLCQHPNITRIVALMEDSHEQLQERLNWLQVQVINGNSNSEPSEMEQRLSTLRARIRKEQNLFHKQLLLLQSQRNRLKRHSQQLLQPLSTETLETEARQVRKEMVESWTTLGLRQTMEQFFSDHGRKLSQVERHIDHSNQLLREIYREHSQREQPSPQQYLDLSEPLRSLQTLERQANQQHSYLTVMRHHKNRVIEIFFDSLVSQAQEIQRQAQQDVQNWADEALAPLIHRALTRKRAMEQQVVRLKRLERRFEQSQSLLTKAADEQELQEALYQVERMLDLIYPSLALAQQTRPRPNLAPSLESLFQPPFNDDLNNT